MSIRDPGLSATRLLLVVVCALLTACTEPIVFGSIPPSTFQFTNVVGQGEPGAGGWKVAQVVILLGRLSPRYPQTTLCEIEVGVPEFNKNGPVSDTMAQSAAADAADEAAQYMLKERLPTALACREFRERMQSIMGDIEIGTLPGTRVRPFVTPGIPRTTFP